LELGLIQGTMTTSCRKRSTSVLTKPWKRRRRWDEDSGAWKHTRAACSSNEVSSLKPYYETLNHLWCVRALWSFVQVFNQFKAVLIWTWRISRHASLICPVLPSDRCDVADRICLLAATVKMDAKVCWHFFMTRNIVRKHELTGENWLALYLYLFLIWALIFVVVLLVANLPYSSIYILLASKSMLEFTCTRYLVK